MLEVKVKAEGAGSQTERHTAESGVVGVKNEQETTARVPFRIWLKTARVMSNPVLSRRRDCHAATGPIPQCQCLGGQARRIACIMRRVAFRL